MSEPLRVAALDRGRTVDVPADRGAYMASDMAETLVSLAPVVDQSPPEGVVGRSG